MVVRKTLEELKAESIERATCAKLGFRIEHKTDPAKGEEAMHKANEYFQHFAAPNSGKCIMCGEEHNSAAAVIMGTGFRWGAVHGEGYCGTCGYPARAIHEIDGVGTISGLILQYHPSEVEKREPDEEAQNVGDATGPGE